MGTGVGLGLGMDLGDEEGIAAAAIGPDYPAWRTEDDGYWLTEDDGYWLTD